MIFVAALVALQVGAFAWAAVDESTASAALPLGESVLVLIGLAIPRVRRAMLDAILRYWPAALVAAALIGAAIYSAIASTPVQGVDVSRADAWRLIGFCLTALAAVGGALAAGWRQLLGALLAGAIAMGALAAIQHLQLQSAHALLGAPNQAAALFALYATIALYGAVDALAARPAQAATRHTTRAERLFLPAAAFLAALLGLVVTDSLPAFAAFAAASAVLGAGLALRERRFGIGLLSLAMLAVIAAGAGAGLILLEKSALGGAVVFRAAPNAVSIAAALAWLALLARLAWSIDRRRHPSRGLAVALAALTIVFLAGPGAAAAAPLGVLALAVGLAGAHADALGHANPESRS